VREERSWISPEMFNLFPGSVDEDFERSYSLPDLDYRVGHHLPVDPEPITHDYIFSLTKFSGPVYKIVYIIDISSYNETKILLSS
jgi:hypothetical protein